MTTFSWFLFLFFCMSRKFSSHIGYVCVCVGVCVCVCMCVMCCWDSGFCFLLNSVKFYVSRQLN